MDWNVFVDHLSKNNSFPVLVPLLKQSKISKLTGSECVIECENIGAKMYLDSKRTIIESLLNEFTQKEYAVMFSVGAKTKRKSRKQRETEEASISFNQFQGNLEDKAARSGLQPRFTFENFAVSNSNHMAYAAAQAVSKHPGSMYNPLFIYGTVGVGKTHLSQAVANAILQTDMTKRVLYCTSEQFTNDLVESIRSKNTKNIRDKYRSLDVLVVDDAQFIAGKNYVQEEFYHTFNTIVQNGGQIILTSDRSPKEIKELEDRLRSRFSGGLIIDMQSPDFELRTAIVLIKAKERNVQIDMEAAQNIAENIKDSRELEGALLKLLSISLTREDSNIITADTAHAELERREEEKNRRIKPQDIIHAVATYYDIKPSQLKGSSRKQNVALARQISMYLLRKKLQMNLEEVAFLIKRKDHTTVLHGVGKIEGMMMKDEEFKKEILDIYDSALTI